MDAHPKLNLERNIVFLLFSFVVSENVMFVFQGKLSTVFRMKNIHGFHLF